MRRRNIVCGVIVATAVLGLAACSVKNPFGKNGNSPTSGSEVTVSVQNGEGNESGGSGSGSESQSGIGFEDPSGSQSDETVTVNEADFTGHFEKNDSSMVELVPCADESFYAHVSFFRLCNMEDMTGTLDPDKPIMHISGIDPSGKPIKLDFVKCEDGYKVVIIDSVWEYLHNGDEFEGYEYIDLSGLENP